MRTSLIVIAVIALSGVASVAVAEDPAAQMVADAYRLSKKSLATVQWVIDDGTGERSMSGSGFCVKVDEQGRGILAVLGMNPGTPPEFFGEVQVIAPGNKVLKASLIGVHKKATIGLGFVRVDDAHEWEAITFAERSNLSVGDRVVSIGLLSGELMREPYVGTGLISAEIAVPERTFCVANGGLTGSGSPVFDAEGRAVGLVGQQIFTSCQLFMQRQVFTVGERGQHWTMCFIPSEEFAFALATIPSSGADLVPAPWLGVVRFEPIPENLWEINQMTGPGLKLHDVAAGHPAEIAGLIDGDILVGINGTLLADMGPARFIDRLVTRRVARMNVGDVVTLDVLRNGEPSKIDVTLEAWPERPDQTRRFVSREMGVLVREKVELDRYVDKTASGMEVGLIVMDMAKDGPAQKAGLKANDTIKAVNGEPVTTVDGLEELVAAGIEEGRPLDVAVSRAGELMTFTVQISQGQGPFGN